MRKEMRRHKYADAIHAWAEGAELQFYNKTFGRWETIKQPSFLEGIPYRIKPKEPEWWENIPEHGVLCWVSDLYDYPRMYVSLVLEYRKDEMKKFWLGERGAFRYAVPLTNEELERFKR